MRSLGIFRLLIILPLITLGAWLVAEFLVGYDSHVAAQRAAAAGGPVVIDFETLPDGSPTREGDPIYNQYESLGVVFAFPGPPVIKEISAIARSGSRVLITRPISEEFNTGSLVIKFTAPQRRVRVWVGQTQVQSFPQTAILRVYAEDSGGSPLGEDKKPLQTAPVGLPAKADLMLEVTRESASIRRAEVLYVKGPNEIASSVFEAIDDLEFEGESGPPPRPDAIPPKVTITEPADNASITNSNKFVRLAGFVNEETALQDLTVTINGSAGLTRTLSNFGFFGNTPRFDFGPTLTGELFSGLNTITVRARDFANNQGEASIKVTFFPTLVPFPSTIDLFPLGMEVTQAIVPLVDIPPPPAPGASIGNVAGMADFPLVSEKLTVVRVYGGMLGAQVPVYGVTAELAGFGSDGQPLPRSPLIPVRELVGILPDPDLATKAARNRREINASWNFVLPPEWTSAGTIRLIATVNPRQQIRECPGCFTERNDIVVTNVIFNPVPHLNITSVPVDLGGNTPPAEALTGTFSYLRSAFPVPDVKVELAAAALKLNSPNPSCRTVLDALRKKHTIGSNPRTFIYGVMPYGLGDCSGMAYFNSSYAIGHGVAGQGRGPIAAQEIGHDLGYTHASCVHGGERQGGGCEDWPYPHGGIDSDGGAGLATDSMLVIPALGPFPNLSACRVGGSELCQKPSVKDHAHDFMSYGDEPRWISLLTWRRFYSKLSAILFGLSDIPFGTALSSSANEYLIAGGRFDESGNLELQPFYRVKPSANSNDSVGSGSYAIELQRANGQPLFTRRFEPNINTHGDDGGSFLEVLPYSPVTARIVVRRESTSQILATVTVSQRSPTVQVVSPNGGELWSVSGAQTINWIASDIDGDALRYTVQYSADGGQNWQPLAVDIAETSLTINTALLAGSDRALISVLATDGVNIGDDVSDSLFKVAKKTPLSLISAPGNNSSFASGSVVLLQGAATDFEDGALSGQRLSWRSDRDGLLGAGERLTVRNLSIGVHTITLTTTDSDGNQAETKVHLNIVRSQAANCSTICFRSPQYFLLNATTLPSRVGVEIGGVNFNVPTRGLTAIKLALRGGSNPLQQLNEQFVAAQLNLIGAGGHSSPSAFTALRSPLSCYGLNFSPVTLSNSFTLRPDSLLNDLFEQARFAIRDNRTADMLAIASLFKLLNGDDPLGRCWK